MNKRMYLRWMQIIVRMSVTLCLLMPVDQAFSQARRARGAAANNMENFQKILDLKVLSTEKELEERVRKILSSQLDSPYSLFVKITVDQQRFKQKLSVFGFGTQMRTLPDGANEGAARYVRNLSIEDVFSLVKSLKVSMTIDKSLSAEQEASLKKTISAALNLNTARGDTLEIERSDLTSSSFKSKQEAFNREAQSASFQNKKLEMMLRELELQNRKLSSKDNAQGSDALISEVRKIADDLKDLKSQTEKQAMAEKFGVTDKIAQIEKNLQNISEKMNSFGGSDGRYEGPLGKIKKLIAGLELPLTLLPLGIVFALVLSRMAGGQGRTALALKGGLEELGRSVQTMADTLAAAAKNISAAASASNQAANERSNEKEASQQASQSTPEGGALELLRGDAMSTWQKLIEMPYFMLSVLKDWLAVPENREKFLQVTEAVGAESAAWIWSKFPAEEIEQLGPLLNKPVSKVASYGAVSLLYRAAVREAGTKPGFVREMPELEFLIALSDAKLAELLVSCKEDEAAMILSLLSPQRAAKMMGLMGDKLTTGVFKVLERLAQAKVQDVQTQVSNFRKSAEAKLNTMASSGLLNCLVRVLESQDAFAQGAARKYLEENSSIASEVRKRVITFDDVMTLDQDFLYEIFGGLSPAETSSLVSTLKSEHRESILKFFAGKAKLQIDDELKKMDAKKRLKKQAAVQGEKIKSAVLRRVRVMRDQGLVDFDAPSAPAANAGGSAPAGNPSANTKKAS